jgi:hypothetical protein
VVLNNWDFAAFGKRLGVQLRKTSTRLPRSMGRLPPPRRSTGRL